MEKQGILENSVWLKIGVFGIIEPNTPYFLFCLIKVQRKLPVDRIKNDARNALATRSREMDLCDENKDIDVQIVDMYSKIRLASIQLI